MLATTETSSAVEVVTEEAVPDIDLARRPVPSIISTHLAWVLKE
jgi:hypothetical protein